MAARWALVAALVLLLPLLPPASSMIFKLSGNVYPIGYFFVTMNIGEPAKPYFLHIDTASNVTWLKCDAGSGSCRTCNQVPHPLYKPIPTNEKVVKCEDSLCDALHRDLGAHKDCSSRAHQCDYEINYLDKSSSMGVLVLDKFTFAKGNPINIAFGCGYNQVKSQKQPVPVDGLIGLGRGSVDLVSQLKSKRVITKNVIAHCLSTKGGGFLSIGAEVNLPASRLTWVPMAPAAPGKPNYYSPGRAKLHLDTKPVGANSLQVVLDSGSTYTVLPENLYTELASELKDSVSKSLKLVKDPELPLCWRGPRPFRSVEDLKKEFKLLLSLKFDSGVTMMIPPENYLIINKDRNACLGVVGMKNLDIYIIGDVTMQDQLVIYDNEKGQIGWMRAPCDKLPKSTSAIVSRI